MTEKRRTTVADLAVDTEDLRQRLAKVDEVLPTLVGEARLRAVLEQHRILLKQDIAAFGKQIEAGDTRNIALQKAAHERLWQQVEQLTVSINADVARILKELDFHQQWLDELTVSSLSWCNRVADWWRALWHRNTDTD